MHQNVLKYVLNSTLTVQKWQMTLSHLICINWQTCCIEYNDKGGNKVLLQCHCIGFILTVISWFVEALLLAWNIRHMIDSVPVALLLPFSWNLFSDLFPKRTEGPVCIIPIFNVNTPTDNHNWSYWLCHRNSVFLCPVFFPFQIYPSCFAVLHWQ